MGGDHVEETGRGPKGGRRLTLHIYVRGVGPRFVVEEELLGWDADRLDVRAILRKYRLKALYALSSSGKRGLHIAPLPRNGLSLTTYSGRADAVVHLDAEPQEPWYAGPAAWSGAILLGTAVATGLLALKGHSFVPEDWAVSLSELNRYPSWPVVALGLVIFVLLFWKRLTMWYK